MLDLRPDTKLGRSKRISPHAVAGDTHPAEVVLIQRYGGAGKAEVPGFQTGLRKGNVATDTLGLPLEKIQRQRAYCNTKTAENGFLIVHAYQERK